MIPEIPARSLRFIYGERQLRDLVHIVPPASGQGLAAWLFSVLHPDRRGPAPPYLAQGGSTHFVITLNRADIWSGGQSYPPDHRDSPRSLANRIGRRGRGGSLEDACLFWNLRANRSPGLLPAWVTPEQAEQPDVKEAIIGSARRIPEGFGLSTDDINGLHFLSATIDTQDIAHNFLCETQAVGWAPTDWISFFDRRHRPFYGYSKEVMAFSKGQASFVVNDDALPCPRPTHVTVDVEIESFRPAPTRVLLLGTNSPRTGRFGEAVISLNCWTGPVTGEEASLGYPSTFDIVRHACEEAGLRPTFDRKAALPTG